MDLCDVNLTDGIYDHQGERERICVPLFVIGKAMRLKNGRVGDTLSKKSNLAIKLLILIKSSYGAA
jgi:hypothetical protein